MNTPSASGLQRARNRLIATTAVLTAAVGAIGALAVAETGDDRPLDVDRTVEATEGALAGPDPATPIWIRVDKRLRLCRTLADVPPGVPAAEAMRRESQQPLGTNAERDEWRRVAAQMPAYWPAAQQLRAAADQQLDCDWWAAR